MEGLRQGQLAGRFSCSNGFKRGQGWNGAYCEERVKYLKTFLYCSDSAQHRRSFLLMIRLKKKSLVLVDKKPRDCFNLNIRHLSAFVFCYSKYGTVLFEGTCWLDFMRLNENHYKNPDRSILS